MLNNYVTCGRRGSCTARYLQLCESFPSYQCQGDDVISHVFIVIKDDLAHCKNRLLSIQKQISALMVIEMSSLRRAFSWRNRLFCRCMKTGPGVRRLGNLGVLEKMA